MPSSARSRFGSAGARVALAFGALALSLLAFELLARVWVAIRWPEQRAYELTHATATRGRYTTHPTLGYALTPDFSIDGFTHDARGLRAPAVPLARTPGVARVAILGASTVYGIYVRDEETSAAALARALAANGVRAEVANAGVPGWTSHETLASHAERVGPLAPDVAIVVDGRNEAFAQLWNGYRDDYAHYRDPAYELVHSNAGFKRLFRVSRLAMILVARGELFGFSMSKEHPLYGAIRRELAPTPDEARAAVADPARALAYESNLRALHAELAARGTALAFATIPFWQEKFASGVLEPGDEYVESIGQRVRANNEIVRALARELGAPLADLETLVAAGERWLHDDCHFNVEGEEQAAELMRAAVQPLLEARGARELAK